MTSSGHVTLSGPCTIDSQSASSYSLYVETIPLSGLVSEIFSPKVATMIIIIIIIIIIIGATQRMVNIYKFHH